MPCVPLERQRALAGIAALRVPRRTSLRRHRRSAPTLRAHASRSAILRCSSVGYFVPVSAPRRAWSGRTIVTRAIRSRFFEVPLPTRQRYGPGTLQAINNHLGGIPMARATSGCIFHATLPTDRCNRDDTMMFTSLHCFYHGTGPSLWNSRFH